MVNLIVYVLATWRLASLLATEDGPWDCFDRLRILLGVLYHPNGVPVARTTLGKGIICVWCNSVWIGAVFTLLSIVLPDIAVYAALPFALSAGAVIVNGVTEWLEHLSPRS